MRKRLALSVAGVLLTALVAGSLTIALAAPGGPMGVSGSGMQGGRGGMIGPGQGMPGMVAGQGMDLDRHFIEEMIPHHEDAVVMADLALAQAEHSELRELAVNIKQVQSDEITQMRQWYLAWYGTEVPPGMMAQGMPGMGGMMGMGGMPHEDPAALDGAQPFDKAFIEQMIPHHQMAVMMSSHLLQGVQQPELRTMLESIITSQNAEIEQMRQWYRDWYGSEVSGSGPGQHHGPSGVPGMGGHHRV